MIRNLFRALVCDRCQETVRITDFGWSGRVGSGIRIPTCAACLRKQADESLANLEAKYFNVQEAYEHIVLGISK